MPAPKILVLPGCVRPGSHNARLAALAAKELGLADADVTRVSLVDYPMPIYDADGDGDPVTGSPANAVKFKRMLAAHHGAFIATPELNASIPPLLKNAIDWTSRIRERGDPADGILRGRVFAIGAATTERTGGVRALMALRQVLEIGCGALVLPDEVAVADADSAFDEMDGLKDAAAAATLRRIAQRLVELTWQRG
jgi:NAD(P)H-dependent FMN reductase